ncbi:MAG: energy transducer TonB [Taibaiella sp.]|nr:energy transducer TonB [Taibaiella sp.]
MNKIILLILYAQFTSCNEAQQTNPIKEVRDTPLVGSIHEIKEFDSTAPGGCIWYINEEGDLVIAQLADTPLQQHKDTGKTEVFSYVEQMPEAPYNVNTYLAKNMRYPEDAKQEGISGKVVVKFIVRASGSIDSVRIRRGIYPSLDKEAIRLVTAMPPWKPGIQNGQPVDVNYMMLVAFKLE